VLPALVEVWTLSRLVGGGASALYEIQFLRLECHWWCAYGLVAELEPMLLERLLDNIGSHQSFIVGLGTLTITFLVLLG